MEKSCIDCSEDDLEAIRKGRSLKTAASYDYQCRMRDLNTVYLTGYSAFYLDKMYFVTDGEHRK